MLNLQDAGGARVVAVFGPKHPINNRPGANGLWDYYTNVRRGVKCLKKLYLLYFQFFYLVSL